MNYYRLLSAFFTFGAWLSWLLAFAIAGVIGSCMAAAVNGDSTEGWWGAGLFLFNVGYTTAINRMATADNQESFDYWGKLCLLTAVGIFCGYIVGGNSTLTVELIGKELLLGSIAATFHGLATLQALESLTRPTTHF